MCAAVLSMECYIVSSCMEERREHCGQTLLWPLYATPTTYHYSIDDIIAVVLEGSDSLCSRHVGLLHHQLNVLVLHATLINLTSANI